MPTTEEQIICEGCGDSFDAADLNRDGYCDECQDAIDFDPSWDEWDEPQFQNPGSALRMATPDNPRIHPCPTCGASNRLTQEDVDLSYVCDRCADRAEHGLDY